jgi:hypothetical protein
MKMSSNGGMEEDRQAIKADRLWLFEMALQDRSSRWTFKMALQGGSLFMTDQVQTRGQ